LTGPEPAGAGVNLVPSQYREVSVAEVPVTPHGDGLRDYLMRRPVYRRTRYVIARHGEATAVAEVGKDSEHPLFSPVSSVRLLAGPDECAMVDAPEADTAVPTQLARVAAERAPGARCVVVRGRYGHVSFILDPAPVRVRVVEVVPPWPPKLVDQLSRVLDLAEDLPPVELVPDLIDLGELAGTRPAARYLFPCRAGQAGRQVPVCYLDEIPERRPWTLVGCARSRAIHDWFYGGEVPTVDMCPRHLAARRAAGRNDRNDGTCPQLTKCCLLEDRLASDGDTVVVPWGASLAQIREGLRLAVAAARP
jgi:hypothetical protein